MLLSIGALIFSCDVFGGGVGGGEGAEEVVEVLRRCWWSFW